MVFLDLWNTTRAEQSEFSQLEKKRTRQETPSKKTLTRPKKRQKASAYSALPNLKHTSSSSPTEESLSTPPLDLEELQNQLHADLDFFQGLGMVESKLEEELEEGEIVESFKKAGDMESSAVTSETCETLPYNRGQVIVSGKTNFVQCTGPLVVPASSSRQPLVPFPAQGARPIVPAAPTQLIACGARPFIPLLPGQPPPPPGQPPPSLVHPPFQFPMPRGLPPPPTGQIILPLGPPPPLPWHPPPPPGRPLSSSSKKKRQEGYFKGHVGDTLGKEGSKYRLLASQGRGSFSSVFRVKNLQDNQIVVLKVGRSNARRATHRERDFLSQLQFSPGCVRLLDDFEWEKEGGARHICLVLEPLACDLRRLVKHCKGLKPQTIQVYAKQLFATLGDLSNLQIIHGDIKPDNILVSTDRQRVKLADFGSSLTLADVKTGTQALGSRWYRAPELLTSGKRPHTASLAIDVWALGCVLCEVYTAEVLFRAGSDDHKLLTMIYALCGDNFNIAGVTKREWSNVLKKGYERKLVKQLRDLLISCLVLKPERRIKPHVALLHPFCRC